MYGLKVHTFMHFKEEEKRIFHEKYTSFLALILQNLFK